MANTKTSPFFSRPDIQADYVTYCAEQGLAAGITASARSYLGFVKAQFPLHGKEFDAAAGALAGTASAQQSQRTNQPEGDRAHDYPDIPGFGQLEGGILYHNNPDIPG